MRYQNPNQYKFEIVIDEWWVNPIGKEGDNTEDAHAQSPYIYEIEWYYYHTTHLFIEMIKLFYWWVIITIIWKIKVGTRNGLVCGPTLKNGH